MSNRRFSKAAMVLVSLAGVLIGFSSSSVLADSITTAMGSGTDAYIFSGKPDTVQANTGDLAVKNDGNETGDPWSRKAYLRFDLSKLLPGTENHIASSSLALTYDGNSAGGLTGFTNNIFSYELFGLKNGQPADGKPTQLGSWTTSEITWDNAPANTTTDGLTFTSADVVDLGSATIATTATAGAKLTFSSSALTSFLNSDTNGLVTLMIARNTNSAKNNGYFDFASSTNANASYAPTLDVSAAAPLPSAAASLALLCPAALLLVRCTRRQPITIESALTR